MKESQGITLGRNVAVKLTGNLDYDRYLLQHETGHLSQINDMGAAKFYGRTAKEYIIKPGFSASYLYARNLRIWRKLLCLSKAWLLL
jgi:hypothetical protein